MMNNNTEIVHLKVEEARAGLDLAVRRIREAVTVDEIAAIQATARLTEAYLRERAVVIAMGDQLDTLRADLRAIKLRADVRLGEISKGLPPEAKEQTAAHVGIPVSRLRQCESAANLDAADVDSLARRGVELSVAAKIGAAPVPVRRAALASIADAVAPKDAVAAASAAHWRGEAAKRGELRPKRAPAPKERTAAQKAEGAHAKALLDRMAALVTAANRAQSAARLYYAAAMCVTTSAGDLARARSRAEAEAEAARGLL